MVSGEPCGDPFIEGGSEGLVVDLVERFPDESGDQQGARLSLGDPARLQVEQHVLIELARR